MSQRHCRLWFAPLVSAFVFASIAASQAADPQPTPLPPAGSKGFTPTLPKKTPGQMLVPPPQGAKGGVITPPTAVDTGMARPTPPAQAFPTPVIKPTEPSPQ